MSNVTIQKRGNFYQYKFEIAKVDGKRKFLSKSGFKTKSEAEKEGNLNAVKLRKNRNCNKILKILL